MQLPVGWLDLVHAYMSANMYKCINMYKCMKVTLINIVSH